MTIFINYFLLLMSLIEMVSSNSYHDTDRNSTRFKTNSTHPLNVTTAAGNYQPFPVLQNNIEGIHALEDGNIVMISVFYKEGQPAGYNNTRSLPVSNISFTNGVLDTHNIPLSLSFGSGNVTNGGGIKLDSKVNGTWSAADVDVRWPGNSTDPPDVNFFLYPQGIDNGGWRKLRFTAQYLASGSGMPYMFPRYHLEFYYGESQASMSGHTDKKVVLEYPIPKSAQGFRANALRFDGDLDGPLSSALSVVYIKNNSTTHA
ncbi:hypothetical protein AA313_de0201030 [Arthrobotrys entomopaga]|nr:hypothetical protein AA313_de0201030 [Arthrobotrys entomopaga]